MDPLNAIVTAASDKLTRRQKDTHFYEAQKQKDAHFNASLVHESQERALERLARTDYKTKLDSLWERYTEKRADFDRETSSAETALWDLFRDIVTADPTDKPLAEDFFEAISLIGRSTAQGHITSGGNAVVSGLRDTINAHFDYREAVANNASKPGVSAFIPVIAQRAVVEGDADVTRFESNISSLFLRIPPCRYPWLVDACSDLMSQYNGQWLAIIDALEQINHEASALITDINGPAFACAERDHLQAIARVICNSITLVQRAGFPTVLGNRRNEADHPVHGNGSTMAVAYVIYLGSHLRFIQLCNQKPPYPRFHPSQD